MEFRKLRASEIEVRVARVTSKSVILLLYKDARCDQNILDETVGCMNWQREHLRDNANCIVSIWDEKKNMWVSKEDTGTQSYTEKEKGLASDSFKRACFNWGIGRELYTSPDMYFPLGQTDAKDGKCYDKFVVTDIQYAENRISSVTILDTNTNRGKTFKGAEITDQERVTEDINKTNEIAAQKIDEIKAKAIQTRCVNANINTDAFLAMYNVSAFTELTEEQFYRMNQQLEKQGF